MTDQVEYLSHAVKHGNVSVLVSYHYASMFMSLFHIDVPDVPHSLVRRHRLMTAMLLVYYLRCALGLATHAPIRPPRTPWPDPRFIIRVTTPAQLLQAVKLAQHELSNITTDQRREVTADLMAVNKDVDWNAIRRAHSVNSVIAYLAPHGPASPATSGGEFA